MRWSILLALLAGLVVVQGGAQTQAVRLSAVAPAQVKALRARLDARLLPEGASHLKLTAGQTFQLVDGARSLLTLIPVEFNLMTEHSYLSVCGLFMLPGAGPERFVTTYGMREEEPDEDVEDSWECARTTAVGVMPGEGEHPRLLMTMAGFSPPQHETVMPVVMKWDAGRGSYVVSRRVFRDNSFVGNATIAKMRAKLLAAKKP